MYDSDNLKCMIECLEEHRYAYTKYEHKNGYCAINSELLLNQLKLDEKEIRNKTIDEFAGLLIEILESWAEINRMAFAIHSNDYSYLTTAKAYDRVVDLINEMAEDTKGESDDK